MSDSYQQLADKVDAFGERVDARYPNALTCHAGCSQCCLVHLTVLPLEFERIEAAVLALPAADQEALSARVRAGKADPRCPLLDDSGQCRVYAARPMICRSHGLPISVGDPQVWDVCPLNFPEGPDLAALDPDVVMNVSTVNVILGMMSHVRGEDPTQRIDLFEGLSRVLQDSEEQA
jgi:Fe-S-cluster containining protein